MRLVWPKFGLAVDHFLMCPSKTVDLFLIDPGGQKWPKYLIESIHWKRTIIWLYFKNETGQFITYAPSIGISNCSPHRIKSDKLYDCPLISANQSSPLQSEHSWTVDWRHVLYKRTISHIILMSQKTGTLVGPLLLYLRILDIPLPPDSYITLCTLLMYFLCLLI